MTESKRKVLLVCLVAAGVFGVAACSSRATSNRTTAPTTAAALTEPTPKGVTTAVWSDYCRRIATLQSVVQGDNDGTETFKAQEAGLNEVTNGLGRDVAATPGAIGTKMQILSNAIGSMVVIPPGPPSTVHFLPDFSKVEQAVLSLPSC